MIDAVIFDMDGVIVNSEPIYQKIEKEMFGELDIRVDPGMYRTFVGLKTREMWRILVDEFHLPHHPADLDQEEEKRYHCPECNNPLFRGTKRCNKCGNPVDVD